MNDFVSFVYFVVPKPVAAKGRKVRERRRFARMRSVAATHARFRPPGAHDLQPPAPSALLPARLAQKAPKGRIPGPTLLASYPGPTRVLLPSYSRPTAILLASYSPPTRVLPFRTSRKHGKKAGKMANRDMQLRPKNISTGLCTTEASRPVPLPEGEWSELPILEKTHSDLPSVWST